MKNTNTRNPQTNTRNPQTDLYEQWQAVCQQAKSKTASKGKAKATAKASKHTTALTVENADTLCRAITFKALNVIYAKSGDRKIQLLYNQLVNDFRLMDNGIIEDTISNAFDIYQNCYAQCLQFIADGHKTTADKVTMYDYHNRLVEYPVIKWLWMTVRHSITAMHSEKVSLVSDCLTSADNELSIGEILDTITDTVFYSGLTATADNEFIDELKNAVMPTELEMRYINYYLNPPTQKTTDLDFAERFGLTRQQVRTIKAHIKNKWLANRFDIRGTATINQEF